MQKSTTRGAGLIGATFAAELLTLSVVLPHAQAATNSHLGGPFYCAAYVVVRTCVWAALAVSFSSMLRSPHRSSQVVYGATMLHCGFATAYWAYTLSSLQCRGCLEGG